MKRSLLILSFFLGVQLLFAQVDSKRDSEKYNQYAQPVELNNVRHNYSQQEIEGFQSSINEGIGNQRKRQSKNANKSASASNCEVLWEDAIFGTCIGRNNSLIPFDFENDGTIELIANASNAGFGGRGFWYILKYNENTSSYEKIYVSDTHEEDIRKITIADLQDDGTMELLTIAGDELSIYDLSDVSLIHSMIIEEITDYFGAQQIRHADADNDGQKEIVLSSEDELVLINDETWQIESTVKMDAGDFGIGNVDEDPNVEIVFIHGLTLEMSSDGSYIEEYDFRPDVDDSYGGYIELSDIDSDGYQEAIVANSWSSIIVYDVDILAPKYDLETDLDIDALSLIDLNNDGVEDILYGDGQWGNIYAHDASNGAKLWEIDNPEHGTTGIAIADFDGDGWKEVVWGSGCSSSGSDYLFFHNLADLQFEWKSQHVDGPFYAIEVADIDQDGKQEIITISYESESGYDSGFLTIYDAVTKDIEFQSDGDFFGSVWTGIYNLEIADYGNDGDLDIIMAAGETYDGKIWVVDGDTYIIEAEHEFPFQEDISEFHGLEVDDIDNDGLLEFLAVNRDRLYIINSEDFSVEWNSVEFFGSGIPQGVLTGNLDDDVNNEIVVCRNYIYRFDDTNFTQLQSQSGEYSAIRLFDWDNDGNMEILAGTTDGFVRVLDGVNLDILETLAVGSESIGGIEVADLNDDGVEELIVTADNKVFFMTFTGKLIQSQEIDPSLGLYDAIVANDYDGDGIPNILLGTGLSVIELNPSCAQCLWFEASFEGVDATCGNDNGQIIGLSPDPTTSFLLLNNEMIFSDSILNLAPGTYQVNAINANNCETKGTIEVADLNLEVNLTKQDKSCFGDNDGEAFVNILEGEMPLDFTWSTGAVTDSISGLDEGTYSVLIIDSNGCEFEETFEVNQSIVESKVVVDNPSCVGMSNGSAQLIVNEGAGGYSYYWDSVLGNNNATNLSGGTHFVSVVDALGCEDIQEFSIESVDLVIETDQVTASCNGDNDGSAVVSILDGAGPYHYQWNSTSINSNLLNNVSSGNYYVTVTDANDCVTTDTVVIHESILTVETSSTDLDCSDDMDGSAVVFVTEGIAPFSYQWQDGSTMSTISDLGPGEYFVLVKDSIGCTVVEHVEVLSPPP